MNCYSLVLINVDKIKTLFQFVVSELCVLRHSNTSDGATIDSLRQNNILKNTGKKHGEVQEWREQNQQYVNTNNLIYMTSTTRDGKHTASQNAHHESRINSNIKLNTESVTERITLW